MNGVSSVVKELIVASYMFIKSLSLYLLFLYVQNYIMFKYIMKKLNLYIQILDISRALLL